MQHLINLDKSIIPACDVRPERYEEIIRETHEITKVGAYKIGAALALSIGLKNAVQIARRYTKKPLIYDHQKAGNDVPDTADEFCTVLKESGIDAVILFPFAGPATQTAWTQTAQKMGLTVIVGGFMTHERFLLSEDGYMPSSSIEKIYTNATFQGVSDYVVPGNKPAVIEKIRSLLLAKGVSPTLYAPGFITQGGKISDAALVAGPRWHAIVGRAIYQASDIKKATVLQTTNI